MAMNTLRSLPIYVEPVEAETLDGFIGRLSAAHEAEPKDIRRAVLKHTGHSSWRQNDARIIAVIEQLARLPRGALTVSFADHGMWVRCGHASWLPRHCERCRRFATPRPACRVCAGGYATETVARGGAVCLEHGIFTYGGASADVGGFPQYVGAERRVRAEVWRRGAALHTGEFNLAAALVAAWHSGARAPTMIDARQEQLHVDSPITFTDYLLCAYPEVVKVAQVLTDRTVMTPLLNVSVSALTQGDRLTRRVSEALREPANDSLQDFCAKVIGHAHRAMFIAYGLRRAPGVKHRLCPLNRALIVAAHSQRSCLLRHALPGALPDVGAPNSGGAPMPRAIRRWPYLVDELALV